MPITYNRVAGQNAERLAALSDGVFAVAMTLLMLDLHAPAAEAVHSEKGLWMALQALGPRLLMFAMSFLTLGIFWVGQQTQLNHLERSEPQPLVDSPDLSVRRLTDAVFHFAAGGISRIPRRAAAVLGEYRAARGDVVFQLDLRYRRRAGAQ